MNNASAIIPLLALKQNFGIIYRKKNLKGPLNKDPTSYLFLLKDSSINSGSFERSFHISPSFNFINFT